MLQSEIRNPQSAILMLTIAIAKGRLQDQAFDLFRRVGIVVPADKLTSRRLLIEDQSGLYSFIFVKASDVPVYVEYGVADAGVCGLDVLLESQADVHEPLDLKFGVCRLVVAGKKDSPEPTHNPMGTARVATKYPRMASDYFQRRGVPIELIELGGSVELAPLLGLSEHIVDLVETGRTIPTILVTAYPDDAVEERMLTLGVECYLRKPFEEAVLIHCLRSAFARGKAPRTRR